MKKSKILLFLILFLSGCTTYKFQKGQPPYDKGFVVSRDGYAIPEYTVGKDNSVPELEPAKERFRRRRSVVEYYYKKMGSIENRFKQVFWDYPVVFARFIGGIFRLPFIAISDYKYEHDPAYRKNVQMREEKQDAFERERLKMLREGLNKYIQSDLEAEAFAKKGTVAKAQKSAKEPLLAKPPEEEASPEAQVSTLMPAAQQEDKAKEDKLAVIMPVEKKEETVESVSESTQAPEEGKPAQAGLSEDLSQQKKEESRKVAQEWLESAEKQKQAQRLSKDLRVVIAAKPKRGRSPLKVNFDGRQSRSMKGRITSYFWEFGDGDVSTKPNPANTYWSATYGSRYFTVTLTVKDDKGNIAADSAVIEVISK